MTEQQHPLTEEIMDEIHGDEPGYSNPYDEEDMRAAADWQLEQVIEWIEECSNYDLDFHSECRRMIADLKQAMRPQEDN